MDVGQLGMTKFSGQKLKMSQALKYTVHQHTLIRLSLFPLLSNELLLYSGSSSCE